MRLLFAIVLFFNALQGEEYKFRGQHFIASYSECDSGALQDVKALKEAMMQAAVSCGATVLDACDFVFDGNGMTMVVLLSESHASIHTYPEHGACFVDLFTCGDKCSHEAFDHALQTYLKPRQVTQKCLVRHEGFEEQ